MKTTSVLLAAAMTVAPFSVLAQESEKPKIAFLEGFCVGLVLGVTADLMIIVGINCYKHGSSTNAPPAPPVLPPSTNAPPVTNSMPASATVLHSGEAAAWSDGPAPYVSSFQTTLQQSAGTNWSPLYRISGWTTPSGGLLVLVSDGQGTPVLTNYGAPLQTLALPLPTNNQCLLRLQAP